MFAQQQHSLPLVNPASSTQQGFLRIINSSDTDGTVRIDAIDDDGDRHGPAYLSLGAMATVHFTSAELENGSTAKGLSPGVGDGDGDWRLELTTELDIEPLVYIRTPDGFVTSMHDVVEAEFVSAGTQARDDSLLYHVRFFNPGKNATQQSRLRLINTSGTENVVTIKGLDDAGKAPSGGDVVITMPAYTARTITAQQLEQGDAGFEGSYGAGTGKWQLFVSPRGTLHNYARPIQVVSLLNSTGTGNLANLSSSGPGNDPNRGGDGVDHITGGGGDDVLNPGDNDDAYDVVFGSAGDDRIIYSDSGPTAYQALNYSALTTGISATINGISNSATVRKGAAGTDTIVDIANPMNASKEAPYGAFGIAGSSSNDTFVLTLDDEGQWVEVRGNAGNDRIDIRSGTVVINYRSSTAGISVDLAAGRASDDGFGGVDTFTGNVRELAGGDGNDTILGTDGNDRLDGGAGNDVLNPRGNDEGNDDVYASTGNDRIVYSDSDTSSYQALWYSRPWRDALTSLDEDGVDVTINGATNRATVDKGSAGTDTIVDINNSLGGYGFGLHGTKGDDSFDLRLDQGQWMQVEGGRGDDTFNLQTEPYESNSRPGSNIRVNYSNSSSGINVDLRARKAWNDGFGDEDTINGTVFQVRGSDHSDVIRGTDGNDQFIGRRGDDEIDGRGGHDTIRFDRDCCATIRNLEVDLDDGTATGTWNGFPFSYKLSSIEEVRSGRGSDTFSGSANNERFRGGGGGDTFIFTGAHGNDRIDGFSNGEDVIVLLGLNPGTSKQDVLDHAWAWNEGIGVHIDLTSFGGGKIDLIGFHRSNFDASDFLI